MLLYKRRELHKMKNVFRTKNKCIFHEHYLKYVFCCYTLLPTHIHTHSHAYLCTHSYTPVEPVDILWWWLLPVTLMRSRTLLHRRRLYSSSHPSNWLFRHATCGGRGRKAAGRIKTFWGSSIYLLCSKVIFLSILAVHSGVIKWVCQAPSPRTCQDLS